MKKFLQMVFGFLLILLTGCATPGQKFITISYVADHEPTHSGHIGIAGFQDMRTGMDEGYVGYRILLDNSQETYFVNGMNLGDTLTKTIADYYRKNGLTTSRMDAWDPSPEGVMASSKGFSQIVTGKINQFECRARKKGPTTDMILDIDLTLFVGMADTHALKTIPVTLTLERTELTFTPEKLEKFVNQALKEVIQKALAF